MASSQRVLLLFAVVASLCAAVVGQPVLPFAPSCLTADNYTDSNQYKKNLDELLAILPAASRSNGWFYNGTAGTPRTADQVFSHIMCYADRNASQCQECLARAPAGITTVCPGIQNVRAAYDACVLRYSPAPPFTGTADLSVAFYVTMVTGVAVDPDKMLDTWITLMTGLTGQAASSPSRVANATTPYDGDPMKLVYGMV